MLMLQPTPKVITFDCYGTLVQWQQRLRDSAQAILSVHGVAMTPALAASFADSIRSRATDQQQRQPYRNYASVLRASLDEALAVLGVIATEKDHRKLWSGLSHIPPHPDAPSALRLLRTQYQLAIISNTDDALIADTVAGLGVPIDFVVTAQQAAAYKPDHRLFEHAHARMGVTASQTIHVAMGQFADLKVCKELGIRSVWINREEEMLAPEYAPDVVLPDLAALPELLLVQ